MGFVGIVGIVGIGYGCRGILFDQATDDGRRRSRHFAFCYCCTAVASTRGSYGTLYMYDTVVLHVLVPAIRVDLHVSTVYIRIYGPYLRYM